MTFRALFFSGFALMLLTAPAQAEKMRVSPDAVVELFTSQGCSSCPPADALIGELSERDDVIALAYHVDYWDYIGWPDSFASPAFSDHQRNYARGLGKDRVYTPQIVVNGVADVVGSRPDAVAAALAESALELPVSLETRGDMLKVAIGADPRFGEATVWLVTFKDEESVEIERGENRGRTIAYHHIVTGRQVLGMWEPQSGARIKLPISEVMGADSDGCAILVQEDRNGLPGRIIGAASFEH